MKGIGLNSDLAQDIRLNYVVIWVYKNPKPNMNRTLYFYQNYENELAKKSNKMNWKKGHINLMAYALSFAALYPS